MDVYSIVSASVTLWTVARQAPLSMGFPRHEYWNGLPFPTPGDISNSGIQPRTPASPALPGRFFITLPPENRIRAGSSGITVRHH